MRHWHVFQVEPRRQASQNVSLAQGRVTYIFFRLTLDIIQLQGCAVLVQTGCTIGHAGRYHVAIMFASATIRYQLRRMTKKNGTAYIRFQAQLR